MKVRWLKAATRCLRVMHARIAQDNPEAAKRVMKRIRGSVKRLAAFPMSGRRGHVTGTREVVIPGLPYLVVYQVRGEHVEILRVFHTSQEPSESWQ
jgi:addiction module RelE/StbE family toxin